MRRRRQERIEPYLDRLYGFALSLAGSPDDAEDLVQECGVRALAARRAPRDEPAYRAWLFTILRNAFLDRLRRRSEIPVEEPEAEVPPLDWSAIAREEQRLVNVLTVRAGLARLPLAQREIIALVDIAGFSYAEAAAQLGVPVGTVMSRLSRARQALLARMQTGAVVHGHGAAGGRGRP